MLDGIHLERRATTSDKKAKWLCGDRNIHGGRQSLCSADQLTTLSAELLKALTKSH